MDLRTFVAIEIPEGLKKHIHDRTKGLRDVTRTVKWVPQENLHITLKFTGRTSQELLPDLKSALEGAARGHDAFEMTFSGAGAFPGIQRPRVVWVGIEAPEGLKELQRDTEAALQTLGFEAETRPYSPHLTIGRVKQAPRGGLLAREIESLEGESFGAFQVKEISLMKSVLSPSGAQYERLFSVPLEG